MRDVRAPLRTLDQLEAPDVWRDAETRPPRDYPSGPPWRKKTGPILVALFLSAVTLALVTLAFADGSMDGTPADTSNTEYEGSGLVLESPDGGVVLCLGTVLDSLPPQCVGHVSIASWDWEGVQGSETRSGTTWGWYRVVGTYDGSSFTVTSSPEPMGPGSTATSPEIETPCGTPEGGWPVPDPGKTSREDLEEATGAARRSPDFAGSWLDGEVLNMAFTGDLEVHAAVVREYWGGALCIAQHIRTLDELERIQSELASVDDELGIQILTSSIDVVHNRVDATLVVVDEQTHELLDARFGEGSVRPRGALTPVGV